jgi:Protein of unknown function (DUF2490)
MRATLLVTVVLAALVACGQGQTDVRALTSFNLEKRIDRSLSITGFVAQIATYDLREVGFGFADLGLKYRLRKGVSFNANYRYMLRRNLENFYDARQMLYVDVDLKHGLSKRWTLGGTVRFQRLHYVKLFDAYRSPLTYMRTRINLSYKVNYYWQPMVECEVFLPIDHPVRRTVDQFRVMAGIVHTFNDRLRVELYEQWQQQVNRPARDTYFLTAMNWYYRL